MLQVQKSQVPGHRRNLSGSFSLMSPHGKSRTKANLKRTSILSIKKKSEWPELVGMNGTEARKRIKEEIPVVQVSIVSYEDMITEEYLPGRVQIFVDDDYRVTWPPQIG